jgi:hypothetical protein
MQSLFSIASLLQISNEIIERYIPRLYRICAGRDVVISSVAAFRSNSGTSPCFSISAMNLSISFPAAL